MHEKSTYQVTFIFVFRPKMNVYFRGRKWMFIFVFVSFSAVNGISFSSVFLFTDENFINTFRSASNIRHKKVLVLAYSVQISLWHFSGWHFNPRTVWFPGLLLPSEINFPQSMHCALLASVWPWSWDAKSWSWSWTLGLVLVLKEF